MHNILALPAARFGVPSFRFGVVMRWAPRFNHFFPQQVGLAVCVGLCGRSWKRRRPRECGGRCPLWDLEPTGISGV